MSSYQTEINDSLGLTTIWCGNEKGEPTDFILLLKIFVEDGFAQV